ncbi:MAG: hypothetical protein AB1567_11945 [bacterium]
MNSQFEDDFKRLFTLINVIRKGSFIVAIYNQEEVPKRIIARLKENFPSMPFHEFHITSDNPDPLQLLRDNNLPSDPPAVVSFYGWDDAPAEALTHLNLSRDVLAEYKHNFIFWVQQTGFVRIAREAPDLFSRCTGGSFDFKINTAQGCGILCLIDIVNFTPQSEKLGTSYTQQFLDYYYQKSQEIVESYNFEWIRSIGDGVLFFGDSNKTQELIQVMLALFRERQIKDRFGFKVLLRMIAHLGYFQFWLDENGKKIDLTGSEAIRTFRIEKEARQDELIVTDALFQGLQIQLKPNNISSVPLGEFQLKGFTQTQKVFLHRLFLPQEAGLSDFEAKLQALKYKSKTIPVLGGLYPPIDIEQNFINLNIDITLAQKTGMPKRAVFLPRGLSIEAKERYEEEKEKEKTSYTAKEVFETFNKGFIYGIPGAGKTTILHYFTHSTFKDEKTPIFVRCRELPDFGKWCERMGHKPESARYERSSAIEYLLSAFLFPKREPKTLTVDEEVALQTATNETLQQWENNSLAIYVDGLDEAPLENRKIIMDIIKNLMKEIKEQDKNKLFLTSRKIEDVYHTDDIPIFTVASLDTEQLRQLVKGFYGEETELYKRFDEVVWREEVVKRIAGTPLTAILLMIYYQFFERIERRYVMYDILVKFFLLQIWERIKFREFKYPEKIREFFIEAKKPDSLAKKPDAAKQYECLSSLSYQCLYESVIGSPRRDINRTTIKTEIEKSDVKDADDWFTELINTQLLIPSGYEELTFLHSTVMEFLAARWIAINEWIDIKGVAWIDIAHRLETLSIASEKDREIGYSIIAGLKNGKDLAHTSLLYRCLCGIERIEKEELEELQTKKPQEEKEKEISKKRPEWVYKTLSDVLMSEDKGILNDALRHFDGSSRLSRNTLLEAYIAAKNFFDTSSELLNLRMNLLEKIVQKEMIDAWQRKWRDESSFFYSNVLCLDTQGYHPDDKNFGYYSTNVGKSLQGFFGSPNLKHDSAVTGCAFSPDGKIILSSSSDRTLRLWDVASGKEMQCIHLLWIPRGISLTEDKSGNLLILTANLNGTLSLFKIEKG